MGYTAKIIVDLLSTLERRGVRELFRGLARPDSSGPAHTGLPGHLATRALLDSLSLLGRTPTDGVWAFAAVRIKHGAIVHDLIKHCNDVAGNQFRKNSIAEHGGRGAEIACATLFVCRLANPLDLRHWTASTSSSGNVDPIIRQTSWSLECQSAGLDLQVVSGDHIYQRKMPT
jgi:hypothetical protein